MNNKAITASAIIAGIVAATALHLASDYGHKEAAVTTAAALPSASPEGAAIGQRANAITVSKPGQPSSRAILDGASTFAELDRRASAASVDPSQRAQYLLTAARVCEGLRAGNGMNASSKHGSDQSIEVYRKYAEGFCKSYSGDLNQFERELLSHQDSDVVLARELAAEVGRGLSQGALLKGQEIVLTSDNPSAIYDAASALASQGPRSRWGLGESMATTPRELEALPQAQWIASQLLACDLSGGCGEGGMTTMIECASYSICGQATTVRDVLRLTSTPVQYELGLRVYEQLYRDRQAAKSIKG